MGHLKEKLFYRVANIKTQQGLWYDFSGIFTGLIHTQFTFCKNTTLPMPFNNAIVGWLSATNTLEALYEWVTKEDIARLKEYGYVIAVYSAKEYKKFSTHWVINQKSSVLKYILYDTK